MTRRLILIPGPHRLGRPTKGSRPVEVHYL